MELQMKWELVYSLGTRCVFIEESKGGLWCTKFKPPRLLKIFAPIFERPIDSSNRLFLSVKSNWSMKVEPNWSRVSHTSLKSSSFVVSPSRSCRDATQIATRRGAQKAMSSIGERATRRCLRRQAFETLTHICCRTSTNLSTLAPNFFD